MNEKNNRSFVILIFLNLLNLVVAEAFAWSFATQLWVYVLQNLAIGIFGFLAFLRTEVVATAGGTRITQEEIDASSACDPLLKRFLGKSGEELLRDSRRPPTRQERAVLGGFFCFVFTGFNLFFILMLTDNATVLDAAMKRSFSLPAVLAATLLFLAFHGLSYRKKRELRIADTDVPKLLFLPFLRIIPTHLVCLVFKGGLFTETLIPFMIAKTVVDAATHWLEHRLRNRMTRHSRASGNPGPEDA